MAEVRLLLEKGAHNVSNKLCNRYFLGKRRKQGKSCTCVPSLSTGFLLTDFQNGRIFDDRATQQQEDLTVRISWDTDTTKSLSGAGNSVTERRICASNTTCANGSDRNPFDSWYRTFCTSRPVWRKQPPVSRCLFGGHGQVMCIRAYSGTGGRSEPLYTTKTGYYEILQVASTATQAQIKTAYYKQSFIYHPDKNAGSEEATVRFSEISEAYTVLGNRGLRKKYDRGLLRQADLNGAARPSSKDPGRSPKQQGESRRSVVGTDSQGVFDFDKFFKSHYGEQLQRERDIRVRKEEMLRKKHQAVGERKLGKMTELVVAIMLIVGVGLMVSLKRP